MKKRPFVGSFLVVAMVSIASLFVVAPAQAATTGNVYVVVNNRVCAQKGVVVRGILASIDKTDYAQKTWDMGDNISYPKVQFGTKNQFSAQVRCYKRVALILWQEVGTRAVVGTFTPTKTNETFWVG